MTETTRHNDIPAFRKEASQPIMVARVICIFAMIYVHVNPGVADFDPQTQGVKFFDGLRFVLTSSLGRASSVLLCIVSGYLAVFSLVRAGYGDFLMKRVRSLVIPTAIWSAAMIGLYYIGEQLKPGYLEQSLEGPFNWLELPNHLFGLWERPANDPLSFLRDLFVCAAFTQFLMMAWKRHWGAWLALTIAVVAAGAFTPLLITPSLFAYYAIGVAMGMTGRIPIFGRGAALLSAVIVLVIGAWAGYIAIEHFRTGDTGTPPILEFWLTAVRIPAAVLFWWFSIAIARASWARHVTDFEPSIFFAFCSHMIILTLMWFAWQRVFGGYYDPAYPVFFFLSPVAVLLIARIAVPVLGQLMPPVFKLINGGRGFQRVPRAQPAASRS